MGFYNLPTGAQGSSLTRQPSAQKVDNGLHLLVNCYLSMIKLVGCRLYGMSATDLSGGNSNYSKKPVIGANSYYEMTIVELRIVYKSPPWSKWALVRHINALLPSQGGPGQNWKWQTQPEAVISVHVTTHSVYFLPLWGMFAVSQTTKPIITTKCEKTQHKASVLPTYTHSRRLKSQQKHRINTRTQT